MVVSVVVQGVMLCVRRTIRAVPHVSQAHLALIELQRSEGFDHIMIAAASDALVPSQRVVARRLGVSHTTLLKAERMDAWICWLRLSRLSGWRPGIRRRRPMRGSTG